MAHTMGPVILDLQGVELSQEEQELLAHPVVAGVILFARNYENPTQLRELCVAIRRARSKPLLIAVDQEGGRVQRFREGFVKLPPLKAYGKCFDTDSDSGLRFAELGGWMMASEVLATGLDLSFSPVLDLDKSMHSVVGDRAFHRDPNKVVKLGRAFIRGMRTAGMAAVGKHFPGHGSVALDSHVTLPIDGRTLDEIQLDDLISFRQLLQTDLDALMPAHIIFSEVDEKPVGFSARWLKKILREDYQFKGALFSDDLNMQGAAFAGNYVDRATAALDAGCNMVLICNNRPAAIEMLDGLSREYLVPLDLFHRLKVRFDLSYDDLKQSRMWKENSTLFLKLLEQNELAS